MDVPVEVLQRLRPICLGLPETYEEPAWVGTRWRVRKKTFAHVLMVDPDERLAHARASGVTEPSCVVTFRAAGDELDAIIHAGLPFFLGGWGRDVVGMVLGPDADWVEVGELLTESYCVLAPKKLVARLPR